MNNNLLDSFKDVESQLSNKLHLETVYFIGNPLETKDNSSYRRKIKLIIPSIKQIDAEILGRLD